jgi:hypothetical protein
MLEKMDRGQGCEAAYKGRQGNEPEIVIRNDAIVDREHGKPYVLSDRGSRTHAAPNGSLGLK